jgi:hypothetical protein
MGDEVIATTAELFEGLQKLELTPREMWPFVGWYTMREWPGAPEPSSATLAKYRKYLRRLGPIAPGVTVELNDALPRFAYRLDLDSASVVRRRVA